MRAFGDWQPTTFVRFDKSCGTSMETARILTDAGTAYLKALGNPQGPHALACELVGTQLARWLGLPTFEFAVVRLDANDEIPFSRGGQAIPGPAFITRAVDGSGWTGAADDLKRLLNPDDITRLVVLDNWTRNADRYPPDPAARRANRDNVFLENVSQGRKVRLRLLAMDHSHCFTNGGTLSRKIAFIQNIQDEQLFGLFPEFQPYVHQELVESVLQRLAGFSEATAQEIIQTVPVEWDVDPQARAAWAEFLCRRAAYLVDSLTERLGKVCWPGQLFDNRGEKS